LLLTCSTCKNINHVICSCGDVYKLNVLLDADFGILQWLYRKTADTTDESDVSTHPVRWHRQNHCSQDEISEFQIHENQSAARARFTAGS